MPKWDWHNINILWVMMLSAISLALWGYGKTSFAFFWYTPWLYLAQASGVVAITTLSMAFIYTTRLRAFQKVFGELQHVYRIHIVNSISGICLIISHFLFFMVHSISYPTLFSYYLIPGTNWSLDYGRISFAIFIVLVIITYIRRIPYHIWKMTHKFMGVALFFGLLHVLTVTSDVKFNKPLRYWLLAMIAVGLVSWVYTLFLYRLFGPKKKYQVTKIVPISDVVHNIHMAPIGKPMRYNPAQFAFFSFDSPVTGKEVHPFTIATLDKDEELCISYKQLGDYTSKLKNVEVGTEVDIWGPYGTFSEQFLLDKRDQVWIGGGIGVTPFLALLKHESLNTMKAKKRFFYCTYSDDDAPFSDHLIQESSQLGIAYHHHKVCEQGYISVDYIKERVPDFKDKLFLVCGPVPMMKLLQKALHKEGLRHSHFIHEDFNLR